MELELENLPLFCYEFDMNENTFFNRKNKSDFYVSREMVIISSLLDKNSINFIVDKNNNIVIKEKEY